jgi:hypothetical protein
MYRIPKFPLVYPRNLIETVEDRIAILVVFVVIDFHIK